MNVFFFLLKIKKMEFVAHPLADDQLSALETLLASHYVVQDLPPDLLALVLLYLKAASRWFPDPQRPYNAEFGYLD